MSEVMPTKEQFESYETVRESGITNMFEVRTVSNFSGLDRPTILSIMKNYERLMRLYPDVRK